MIASILFGYLPLLIWLYLFVGRRFFWLLRERDTFPVAQPEHWPSVAAVVPARNEEDVIARSLAGLLAQDYPGEFRVILVDDQSEDRTSEIARGLGDPRLTVLAGGARPPDWTGKLWAMRQGVAEAAQPEFFWFTDADIAHSPDNTQAIGGARGGRKEGAGLVDGAAPMPVTVRTFPDPRLRLFFRHAVSVRRGERSQKQSRGRGRRLHAGAGQSAWKPQAGWTPSGTTSSMIARWPG